MEAPKPLLIAMLLLFSMKDLVLVECRGCSQFCSSNDDGSGASLLDDTCQPSGNFSGSGGHSCDECCKANTNYPIYTCSPPVSQSTPAILDVNDFSENGDGGGPSECDGNYHDNSERVVALSTGWYAGGSRCGKVITLSAANGMTTTATVVDECDSTQGCDAEHGYQPPCRYNIVDGSSAVWEALGATPGEMDITWRE